MDDNKFVCKPIVLYKIVEKKNYDQVAKSLSIYA